MPKSSTNAPFPWGLILGWALGYLRLTPHAFWALSLPELNALISLHLIPVIGTTRAATNRQQLDQLMQEFPDKSS